MKLGVLAHILVLVCTVGEHGFQRVLFPALSEITGNPSLQ